jgi:hypothetical protein
MKIFTPIPFALLVVLFSVTARSQEIEVEAGDADIIVKGFTGDDTSFNGDVRVTLKNATQALKLHVLASHLQGPDGEQIKRTQIEVAKEIMITPNVPTTIPINVTGVKAPGEYKGQLELLLDGQPRDTAKKVNLKLLANVRSTLTALANGDRLKANLVNCNWPCWLAKWILPGSTETEYEIKFEKPIGLSLPALETEMDVKGERNGVQWKKTTHLKFGELTASPAPTPPLAEQAAQAEGNKADKRFFVFPVTLTYSDLPADHYMGSIYLSLDANTPLIKLPVDVNVRVAPLWPLLFLIAGIVIGKLVKFMQERGGPVADAQIVFNRLELRLREAAQEDQDILEPQMEAADRLINENQPAEATAELKSIGARLTTLDSLRAIEGRLAGKEQHPKVAEVLGQITEARERIRQKDDEDTRALVKVIQDSVVSLSATLMGPNDLPDPDIESARTDAKTAADASRAAAVRVRPLRGNKVMRFFARISGVVDDLRAETALFVMRPLLWFVLLLSLVALGMKSLYIDNPTFGASAVDYVSLIFWGMSSDVASRALGSLKFG